MGLNCTGRVGMGQAQPGEGRIGQCQAGAAGLVAGASCFLEAELLQPFAVRQNTSI